jgi:Holliday junction resolvase
MSFDIKEHKDLINKIREIRGRSPMEAEQLLAAVLRPLLKNEGFTTFESRKSSSNSGVDFVAVKNRQKGGMPYSIGIEYKYSNRNPVSFHQISSVLIDSILQPFNRLVLISNIGFTKGVIERVKQIEPVSIELLDLQDLENWVSRLAEQPDGMPDRVRLLITTLSHDFAILVAENPTALDHLEWRDLERMMERIMQGIGFNVILTRPSKDEGKDLILSCEATDGEKSYIIELKHWRSGVRVGKNAVKDFLNVLVKENRSGALFLSTSGFTGDSFEGLTEIERQHLRFGDTNKIVSLAQTYVRAQAGLWSPPSELSTVLFESTS